MNILNFSQTPKQAFVSGFIKGFTAPSVLFGQRKIPKLHEVRMISIPQINDAEDFKNDWQVVGLDLTKAIEIYNAKNA